jgi:hypothetical protein
MRFFKHFWLERRMDIAHIGLNPRRLVHKAICRAAQPDVLDAAISARL